MAQMAASIPWSAVASKAVMPMSTANAGMKRWRSIAALRRGTTLLLRSARPITWMTTFSTINGRLQAQSAFHAPISTAFICDILTAWYLFRSPSHRLCVLRLPSQTAVSRRVPLTLPQHDVFVPTSGKNPRQSLSCVDRGLVRQRNLLERRLIPSGLVRIVCSQDRRTRRSERRRPAQLGAWCKPSKRGTVQVRLLVNQILHHVLV